MQVCLYASFAKLTISGDVSKKGKWRNNSDSVCVDITHIFFTTYTTALCGRLTETGLPAASPFA